VLSGYVDYYNGTRTQLSLAKDAPEPRSMQPPSQGRVVEVPRVGGLHHEYLSRETVRSETSIPNRRSSP
jgi:putative transposase